MPTISEQANTFGQTAENLGGNAGGMLGGFFGNLFSGVGQGVQGLLQPTGGFVNSLLGSTQQNQQTVQAPDASAQSNSRVLTYVLIGLAVVTVVVVAVVAFKSSSKS